MRLKLTWGISGEEADGLGELEGLAPDDLDDLHSLVPDARFGVEAGSVGKGAAGYGAALIVEVERVLTDLASLAAVGGVLWKVIERIAKKRHSHPTVEDPLTLATLGAARLGGEVVDSMAGCRYVSTVPITAAAGMGTDARDIWAACFSCDVSGSGLVIFLSPSGTCLGSVSVPAEMHFGEGTWRTRSVAEIAEWWHPR